MLRNQRPQLLAAGHLERRPELSGFRVATEAGSVETARGQPLGGLRLQRNPDQYFDRTMFSKLLDHVIATVNRM
jgi:hypothetical protein